MNAAIDSGALGVSIAGQSEDYFACSCGHVHATRLMPMLGYQETTDGVVLELRNCPTTKTTRATQVYHDASVCRGCKGLVRGNNGDAKIVVEHADGAVYCRACAPTLQYVSESVANARALRRVLAANGRLRWTVRELAATPVRLEEDALEASALGRVGT